MAEKDPAFAKRLASFMEEAGYGKKKLAVAVGVSPSAVGAYINEGRIPEAPILLKIARLLNVTIEELLTGDKAAGLGARPPTPRYLDALIKETPKDYVVKWENNPTIREIVQMLIESPREDVDLIYKLLKNRTDARIILKKLEP